MQQQPQEEQEQPFSLGEEFDSNPFEQFAQRSQASQTQAPTGGEQPGAEQDPEAEMQRMQEMQDPKKNQLLPGANPGGSKFLVGAIQQLQGYIGESTERDEIAIARSLIQLLTKLVSKDQQRLADKIAGDNQSAQAPTMPQMPGGMGGGQPQEAPQEAPQGGPQGF